MRRAGDGDARGRGPGGGAAAAAPSRPARLAAAGLFEHPKLRIIEPLGYVEFLGLVRGADAVVTDSGGVQEETTMLGVPCLTLRPNTERPITISNGQQ